MSFADLPPTQYLAAFVTAVDKGSIGAAADELHLTQSAVTKRVRALERQLGLTLLERGRFGVRPVEAGLALYREARAALDSLSRAQAALDVYRADAQSTVRVAASRTIASYLLPGWLSAYAKAAHASRFDVAVANSLTVARLVRNGSAALGFIEDRGMLSGLEALTVASDGLVVVVGPHHRWAKRRAVSVDELTTASYFTREPGSGTRTVVEHALGEVGVRLEPTLEAGSLEALKRSVADGDAFTVLSALAVDGEVARGELASVRVRGVALERVLRAVRRRTGSQPEGARRFWKWLERRVEPAAAMSKPLPTPRERAR
jgi:DNA-binding transcriptional LysR family regulator